MPMTSRIPGTPRAADLLVDDDLLDRAEALAAELLRPGDAGEAGLGELALPGAARGDDLVLVRRARRRRAVTGASRLVRLEPGAHLLAVRGLLRRVVQIHRVSSVG